MDALTLIGLVNQALAQAVTLSSLYEKMRREGRENTTDAEEQMLLAGDDAARQRLVDAIARAKARG